MMYVLTAIISIALSAIITTMLLGARLEKALLNQRIVYVNMFKDLQRNTKEKYQKIDRRLKQLEPVTSDKPASHNKSKEEVFKDLDEMLDKAVKSK